MKPLHIGLLIIGAAIAGGLAVKMTQPVPVTGPVAQVQPTLRETQPEPPAPEVAPPAQEVITAPAPVSGPAKPSPVRKSTQATPAPAIAPPPYKGAEPAPVPEPAKASATHVVEDPGPAIPLPSIAPPPVEPTPITPPPAPEPRRVTLNTGATISARLIDTLSSDKVKPGDRFQATLAEPIVTSGLVIAEKGARVWGRVLAGAQAGKFQGVSRIELALDAFESADGQRVAIATSPWVKQGDNPRNSEAVKVVGGATLGAIIGAIAGGGKGAAIGAGAGGAAGAGAVALTPSKPVTLPTETVIQFRLAAAVTITEQR